MSFAAKLAQYIEPTKLNLPVVKYDPKTEKLWLTPVGTVENNYQPEDIDVSDYPFQMMRDKIDCGWRCYATGGVKEVVARYPADCPQPPTAALKNKKGDAAWKFFIRAQIKMPDFDKVFFEIDGRSGGIPLVEVFFDIVENKSENIFQMRGVVEINDIPVPKFIVVAEDDDNDK